LCVQGARGALEPLFHVSGLDFRMAWAFIDMMGTDNLDRAAAAAARIVDSRLTAFHDADRSLGRAMARRLGWTSHIAWDTYFVYRPGTLWKGSEMPAPDDWFHQLKDREVWERTAEADVGTADWTYALTEKAEADPTRFRTGTHLRVALETALWEASRFVPAHALDAH
jgi:hypothetical protein